MACTVLAGCSLYFGYLAYQGILWMLQSGFFNLDNAAIQWTRHVHFYALLLSVFFFADFIIHDMGKEDRNALAAYVNVNKMGQATDATFVASPGNYRVSVTGGSGNLNCATKAVAVLGASQVELHCTAAGWGTKTK